MLIGCDGITNDEDDEDDEGVQLVSDADVDATIQTTKLALLELLLAHGIAVLEAHADGSGDEVALETVTCYTEPSADQFEECETPDGAEELVETVLEASNVNFNGDGGFFNLKITTATRECELEVGWYYTESGSDSTTETL